MPNCYSLTGYDVLCKLQEAGAGLKRRVYLGLVSDLDETRPFYTNGSGDINGLNFLESYGTLVKFTGVKNGNTANTDIQRTDDGNAFYPNAVVLKLFETETDDKTFLSNLAISEDVFAIIETNSGKFEVLGITQGMTLESAPRAYGESPTDSSARIVTLSGDQTSIEKFFSSGGTYEATVDTLDGYVA